MFVMAASAVVGYSGFTLVRCFRQFDQEASSFLPIVHDIPDKIRIMHVVMDYGSGVATHPVYLHYAALAAARTGGVPSFSLAIDPSFPVGYQKDRKPPGPAWEWRPSPFDWRDAQWYDYYLIRGGFSLESLFRGHASDVQQIRRSGPWTLVRRNP